MSDIFLSYAREDREKAKLLADGLAKQGWSVWWDRQIAPGKSFDRVIEHEISSAKCVVVLWSESSVISDWVRSEAEEGRRRGILIPALIDTSRVPLGHRAMHSVNLTSWDGDYGDKNYQDLIQAVVTLVSRVDVSTTDTSTLTSMEALGRETPPFVLGADEPMSSVITAHSVPAETPPGGAAGSARAPNDAAFDDLFDFLAREAMREVGADRCSIFVLDEERQELWSRVALGIERQVIRFPSNRGIAGFVLQTGTQLNIPKPYDDPRFNQAVDRQTGYRTQSILCAPLRVRDGRIIGVLQVLNKLGGGPFTDLDERTFKRIAHRCALALENALYHEHLLTQKSSDELHRSLKGRSLRVFLCHSSSDKPAVRSLYRRLADEEGIQPWLDEEDLLPGQNWAQEILKAVRASDVVVICISEASSNKAGYLQKEIRYALDVADEQPDGTIFLVPLRLEVCEVPERLSQWQWVNYYEARGYERLMRSLRARAATLSN